MLFEKNETLLFIGDSISDFDRKRPVGEGLFNAWGTSWVADAGAYLTCAWPELNLRVINMGISGNQIRDLKDRWQTDVLDLKPDWVTVLIGINDVWRVFDSPTMPETHGSPEAYEAVYRELLETNLPRVKGMVLMTPYFMEPNRKDPMRAMMDQLGDIVKKLAAEYHQPCVDLQQAWDALFEHMHPCSIAWDRIHPNHIGHVLIAREFIRTCGAQRL